MQLKCIYTSAHSMGNKQEELEAIVREANYDLVAIMETWWDCYHSWSVAVDGYKIFCVSALMLLNLDMGIIRLSFCG